MFRERDRLYDSHESKKAVAKEYQQEPKNRETPAKKILKILVPQEHITFTRSQRVQTESNPEKLSDRPLVQLILAVELLSPRIYLLYFTRRISSQIENRVPQSERKHKVRKSLYFRMPCHHEHALYVITKWFITKCVSLFVCVCVLVSCDRTVYIQYASLSYVNTYHRTADAYTHTWTRGLAVTTPFVPHALPFCNKLDICLCTLFRAPSTLLAQEVNFSGGCVSHWGRDSGATFAAPTKAAPPNQGMS